MRRVASLIIASLIGALGITAVLAQGSGVWVSRDHPAIQYSSRPPRDVDRQAEPVDCRRVRSRSRSMRCRAAISQSVLKALDISPSSQTLVFSENSLQRAHISKATPRAVYFNDTVAVAWAKGADTIEATALDADPGRSLLLDTADAQREAAVRPPQCRLPAVPPAASNPRRAGRADDERAAAVG